MDDAIIICFGLGVMIGAFCIHYVYSKKRQKDKEYIHKLSQHIVYLERKEEKRLKNAEIYKNKKKLEIQPSQPTQEIEINHYHQQLEYINQCGLERTKPINREAVKYFYYLQEWIKKINLLGSYHLRYH